MNPSSLPAPDEIHLWLLEHREADVTLLNEAERTRHESYRFEKDRQRFAFTQSSKRIILARYLGEKPHELSFDANKQGKPSLLGLEFNISHTESLSILAVSAKQSLGIDIEKVRPQEDLEELSEKVLTESEQSALLNLPTREHLAAFYRFWTAKEAYLKAIGTGFEVEPHQVQIDLPDFNAVSSPHQACFSLMAVDCGPDFRCHLAIENLPLNTSLFRLNEAS